MEVNRPNVLEEVTAEFERYELALRANDLNVLDELFWDDRRVVRFGTEEALYGPDALRRFRFGRPTQRPGPHAAENDDHDIRECRRNHGRRVPAPRIR